jgi:CheY-like chemotaxis protein
MRIMIVDDEIILAKLLAESLSRQGHQAIAAASGPEALSVLRQNALDAVFLDIVMPRMNGIEVLRRIRKTHPALPVVIVTGNASPEDLKEVRRLGVTDVVEKPFGLNNLTQALAGLAAKSA